MGRVINIHSAGKERTRLSKATVIAIRELMRQSDVNDKTKDLAAFIALSSEAISNTIEPSVSAWEKRGYWVKADKFMREWSWVDPIRYEYKDAILNEDWPTVARLSAKIGIKLKKVEVSDRHRMGTPWVGSWDKLREKI